jgi:hypothetical protein
MKNKKMNWYPPGGGDGTEKKPRDQAIAGVFGKTRIILYKLLQGYGEYGYNGSYDG